MKTTTKGKLYLIFGLIATGLAIWYENYIASFAGGLSIAWSYWYWWRYVIWKKQLAKVGK